MNYVSVKEVIRVLIREVFGVGVGSWIILSDRVIGRWR